MTNIPPANAPHVFRLSQNFPQSEPPPENYPWLAFDPFVATTLDARREASTKYLQAVLDYVLEGNIGAQPTETDFDLCNNTVRPWFHVPWMDANPSKGREYVHGLTRELAPSPKKLSDSQLFQEAAWAVGFYNARGAYTVGQVFPGGTAGSVIVPTQHLKFLDGAVVAKALFTTALTTEVPYLNGAPVWTANILPPACGGKFSGTEFDPRTQTTVQCRRVLTQMRMAQFDVAVADSRGPLGWTFGTFVYDGSQDASKGWRGLKPVGLMWGNDPGLAPSGTNPGADPPGDRGLTPPENVKESYLFTSTLPAYLQKDLGCAGRMNGPIDNPRSSCMSCHATASVPIVVPKSQVNPCTGQTVQAKTIVKTPILGDFSSQCGNKTIDDVWFRNIGAGQPFTSPSVCAATTWISLDYSLQLEEALANYLGTNPAPPSPPPSPFALGATSIAAPTIDSLGLYDTNR